MTTPSLLVLDTETTGIDVENDRIVTAYAGLLSSDGTVIDSCDILVDPGVPIPEGAAAVHGVTSEAITAAKNNEGPLAGRQVHTPVLALNRLSTFLDSYTSKGIPLAGANLAYDLTLIDREAGRVYGRNADGSTPFSAWLSHINVLDSLVIDKAIDKYRKGSRKLVDTARHYGIPFTEDEAHNADFDAVTAGRILQKMLTTIPALAAHLTPSTPGTPNPGAPSAPGYERGLAALHMKQVVWKREQAASLQQYFRTKAPADKRDPNAIVDGHWPMKPYTQPQADPSSGTTASA